jgi:hypothetical protein
MSNLIVHDFSLDRMVRAVEKVRERLLRATSALQNAGIPYAVVGGNAVAAWVSRVDEAAVRNTQDVDILIRRSDFEAVKTAMTAAGFVFRHVKSIDMFLDGPGTKARDAVHILFAGEKVRPEDTVPTPDISEVESNPPYTIVSLEGLVRMKLNAFRLKDRVHLLDMLDIELIDASWCDRLPSELGDRLRQLIDNPNQ